jgi:hypothetical protein
MKEEMLEKFYEKIHLCFRSHLRTHRQHYGEYGLKFFKLLPNSQLFISFIGKNGIFPSGAEPHNFLCGSFSY